jgi:hypothetical protein
MKNVRFSAVRRRALKFERSSKGGFPRFRDFSIAVFLPIALAASGHWVSLALKERDASVKTIEIAVGILKQIPDPDSPNDAALRYWAMDVIDEYSEVKLPPDARDGLRDQSLPIAGYVISNASKFDLIDWAGPYMETYARIPQAECLATKNAGPLYELTANEHGFKGSPGRGYEEPTVRSMLRDHGLTEPDPEIVITLKTAFTHLNSFAGFTSGYPACLPGVDVVWPSDLNLNATERRSLLSLIEGFFYVRNERTE